MVQGTGPRGLSRVAGLWGAGLGSSKAAHPGPLLGQAGPQAGWPGRRPEAPGTNAQPGPPQAVLPGPHPGHWGVLCMGTGDAQQGSSPQAPAHLCAPVTGTPLATWAWGLWACLGPLADSPAALVQKQDLGRPRRPLTCHRCPRSCWQNSQAPPGASGRSVPCGRCLRKHQFISFRKIFLPENMTLC